MKQSMKVLVTGASGYLGGRLCHVLLRQGHSVRAFVRPTSDLSCLPPSTDDGALELAYGDVTDYQSLLAACSGCSVIFHVAALVEPWLPKPSRFFSVNVGGLKNVLQASQEAKTIEKIIYTSSFFALGATDGYIADENQIHSEKFFSTEYERSKAVADKIALQAAKEGLPIVMVYPGVIYGPGKVTTGNMVAQLFQELENHFTVAGTELLLCMACLNPANSFSAFDKRKLIHLAELYEADFSSLDVLALEDALDIYIFDMRSDNKFSGLKGITELAKKMVKRKNISYPFVFKLITLSLILLVATATVERAFSAMHNVKTKLRNRSRGQLP